MKTPIRSALLSHSPLLAGVCDGLDALEKAHKQLIDEGIRPAFADSLDIDEGMKAGNERENRWDYLLGHSDSATIVGLEPHSAHTSEVSTVIAKKASARAQLRRHLRPGSTISSWFWVASGKVDFAPHEKVIRRLDQEGITFVGGALAPKHLPKPPSKRARSR